MKKMLALALALIMVLSMSVTAFAADVIVSGEGDGTLSNNPSTGDVLVNVVKKETLVYNISIAWTDLNFTYTTGKWNPETHLYDNGRWNNDGEAVITVVNHSNAEVTMEATVSDVTPITGVNVAATVEYVSGNGKMESAEAVALNNPTATNLNNAATCTVEITGDPKDAVSDQTVAKITIIINKVV